VEVLSLSVNNITTLADVQDCKNLQVRFFKFKNIYPIVSLHLFYHQPHFCK
jgi:hypothetical protein